MNRRTTIAGAISSTGAVLFGSPIVLAIYGKESLLPLWLIQAMVLSGIICMAIGKLVGGIFSADAKDTVDLKQEITTIKSSIEEIKGNTTQTPKP